MNRYLFRLQHNAFLLTYKDDLMDWQPDIVHCNDWQTLSLGTYAKSKMGSKFIFDSHELETHRNPPLPKNRKRWMEKYEHKHLGQCDVITTVCEPISEFLHKQYNINQPLVIYNAPIHSNLNLAHKDWGRLADGSNVKKETGLSDQDFLLVSVGNATVNRGIETILEALPDLSDNIHLAIVGKVTPQFKEMLDDLIIKNKLNTRVHFIEPVNPTRVVDFIQTADAGIISLIPATLSYDLALPNKLFECAFADLPIIAADTREIKRKVLEYELGQIYESGNVKALKKAIMNVYHSKGQTSQQKASLKRFAQDHNFKTCAQKLLDCFYTK